MTDLPDDIVVVNCANCGSVCSLHWDTAKRHAIGYISGRVKDRPWCSECLGDRSPVGSRESRKDKNHPGWDR